MSKVVSLDEELAKEILNFSFFFKILLFVPEELILFPALELNWKFMLLFLKKSSLFEKGILSRRVKGYFGKLLNENFKLLLTK